MKILEKAQLLNEFKSGRHTLVVIDQGFELINERFNVWPNKVNTLVAKRSFQGHIRITTTQQNVSSMSMVSILTKLVERL